MQPAGRHLHTQCQHELRSRYRDSPGPSPCRPTNRHGNYILDAAIPLSKLLVFNRLLPQMLKARVDLVVIGGVCEVCIRAL
ncbi:MAG: hypothetical protein HC834_11275 [Rhodospirillales bacterium]|nr:hypothetical protein [Rhodospirillales bacterium]